MRLERLQLVGRQRAEHVRRRGILPALVVGRHQRITAPPPSCSRIFFSPSRIRPLMVPTGASSMSAISVCVKPPK